MSQQSQRFAHHRVAAAVIALAALLPTACAYAQYGPHDQGRGRPDWHGQRGPQHPDYRNQRQPQYNYQRGGGGNGDFIFGALLGAVVGTAVLGAMQPPPAVVYSAPPPPPPPGVYYSAPPPPPGYYSAPPPGGGYYTSPPSNYPY
jgi:hypothetical protein